MEGFKACGGATFVYGPNGTGDQSPNTGKEKQPRHGAAWKAPLRKSGRPAGATLASGKLSATIWRQSRFAASMSNCWTGQDHSMTRHGSSGKLTHYWAEATIFFRHYWQ